MVTLHLIFLETDIGMMTATLAPASRWEGIDTTGLIKCDVLFHSAAAGFSLLFEMQGRRNAEHERHLVEHP